MTLADLSDEVQLHWMNKLPPSQLVRVGQVCRRFRALVRDDSLWRPRCHRWARVTWDRSPLTCWWDIFWRREIQRWQISGVLSSLHRVRYEGFVATSHCPIVVENGGMPLLICKVGDGSLTSYCPSGGSLATLFSPKRGREVTAFAPIASRHKNYLAVACEGEGISVISLGPDRERLFFWSTQDSIDHFGALSSREGGALVWASGAVVNVWSLQPNMPLITHRFSSEVQALYTINKRSQVVVSTADEIFLWKPYAQESPCLLETACKCREFQYVQLRSKECLFGCDDEHILQWDLSEGRLVVGVSLLKKQQAAFRRSTWEIELPWPVHEPSRITAWMVADVGRSGRVFAACTDCCARLWQIDPMEPIGMHDYGGGVITCIARLPMTPGGFFATGSKDGCVRIYLGGSGQVMATFAASGPVRWLIPLVLEGGMALLGVVAFDGKLEIWDFPRSLTLRRHTI